MPVARGLFVFQVSQGDCILFLLPQEFEGETRMALTCIHGFMNWDKFLKFGRHFHSESLDPC